VLSENCALKVVANRGCRAKQVAGYGGSAEVNRQAVQLAAYLALGLRQGVCSSHAFPFYSDAASAIVRY
jgi:hypothetical protein